MRCKILLITKLSFLAIIFFSLNSGLIVHADYINENKDAWSVYSTEVEPDHKVTGWYNPFKTRSRTDINTIKIISTFGSPRNSYVRGHIHTGLDIIPERGTPTDVYPMANGVVCSIHLGDPHRTIVVKHRMPDNEIIFTSYKHLKEIYVQNSKQLTPKTKLARLYTRQEARALGGNYDHLHLEIRKQFDDYGVASWATLTRFDLRKRFYDPRTFMKQYIKGLPRLLVINPCKDEKNLSYAIPVIEEIKNIWDVKVIIRHYKTVNIGTINAISPGAIVITGQNTPWIMYEDNNLKGVKDVIKKINIPILGICGGHQLIGLAFNMDVALIRGTEAPTTYEECFRSEGTIQTEIIKNDLLLAGVNEFPKFYSSHCEEIKKLHEDFDLLVKGEISPFQMIRHKTKNIYGVQFHPEYTVPDDNSGKIILKNFVGLFVKTRQ